MLHSVIASVPMNWESITAEELFSACTDSRNVEAWTEFHRRYHRTIGGVILNLLAARGIMSTSDAEEMIQEVYLHLCRRNGAALSGFRQVRPDSDYAFVKVLTLNVVRDRLRRRGPQLEPDPDVMTVRAMADPGAVTRMERPALIRTIEETLQSVASQRDRTIFWLYYRTGLTPGHIATLGQFGLSPKGIESVVGRLTNTLREKLTGDAGKRR